MNRHSTILSTLLAAAVLCVGAAWMAWSLPMEWQWVGTVPAVLAAVLLLRMETIAGNIFAVFAMALPPVLSILVCWDRDLSDYYFIGGILPFSDAANQFEGAWENYSGDLINKWCSRRPMYPTYLSSLLILTGGFLPAMLLLQSVIATVLVCFQAKVVARNLGMVAAVVTAVVQLRFLSKFSPSCMTENLGFTLGVLGWTFLLIWVFEKKDFLLAVLGIGTLMLAMCVRVGDLFVIAFLMVAIVFPRLPWNFEKAKIALGKFAVLLIAVLAAYGMNELIKRTMVSKEGFAFSSNFAVTLYGLIDGSKWTVALDLYGNDSAKVYAVTMEKLREDPMALPRGCVRAWREGFVEGKIFAYLPQRRLMAALAFAGGLALCLTFRGRARGFGIAVVLGMIASLPFVPPWDAGYRVHAVTVPVTSLFIGISLASIVALLPRALKTPIFGFDSIRIIPGSAPEIRPHLLCLAALVLLAFALPFRTLLMSDKMGGAGVNSLAGYGIGFVVKDTQPGFANPLVATHDNLAAGKDFYKIYPRTYTAVASMESGDWLAGIMDQKNGDFLWGFYRGDPPSALDEMEKVHLHFNKFYFEKTMGIIPAL